MGRVAKLAGEKSVRFRQISAALFLAAGIFWASIILFGQGGLLVVWLSLASFVSAGLMIMKRSEVITRSVALATGFYNFIVFSYQAYSAISLLGSSFASFASLAAVGYILGAVIFLFLLLGLYADSGILGLSSSRFSEDSRKSIRRLL